MTLVPHQIHRLGINDVLVHLAEIYACFRYNMAWGYSQVISMCLNHG